MQRRWQRVAAAVSVGITICIAVFAVLSGNSQMRVIAQANPTPTPALAAAAQTFDQAAAIAQLKEQIKGHENDPATTVFKNIKVLTGTTAGRLMSVME